MISARTKAALAAAKRRGVSLLGGSVPGWTPTRPLDGAERHAAADRGARVRVSQTIHPDPRGSVDQVGIPGDIISECPGDFMGIRTYDLNEVQGMLDESLI